MAKFANNIGYIRETIFGGLWNLKQMEKWQIAHIPEGIATTYHLTYSLDAPGYKYFVWSMRQLAVILLWLTVFG